MLSESRTPLADIHRNIQDSALYNADKLALGIIPYLKMQSTHHAVGALAFVVLTKIYIPYKRVEFASIVRFEKVTAVILKIRGWIITTLYAVCSIFMT